MKKSVIENILRIKMLRTSDELFLSEPGTTEQSLLFLEFYSYERFRLVKMLEVCDKVEEYERWKFIKKKIKEIEKKIRREKAEVMLYENLAIENLTETVKECKIYNIKDYEEEGE